MVCLSDAFYTPGRPQWLRRGAWAVLHIQLPRALENQGCHPLLDVKCRVLVCLGVYNKMPQSGGLAPEIHFLTVLEAGSPRWRCRRAGVW